MGHTAIVYNLMGWPNITHGTFKPKRGMVRLVLRNEFRLLVQDRAAPFRSECNYQCVKVFFRRRL